MDQVDYNKNRTLPKFIFLSIYLFVLNLQIKYSWKLNMKIKDGIPSLFFFPLDSNNNFFNPEPWF